jgi:hypothetical protein
MRTIISALASTLIQSSNYRSIKKIEVQAQRSSGSKVFVNVYHVEEVLPDMHLLFI